MERKNRGRLQRPFVVGGALGGAAFSVYYLYRSSAVVAVPDPIWLRFVNVSLIMFCAIYLANLLRRLIEKRRP